MEKTTYLLYSTLRYKSCIVKSCFLVRYYNSEGYSKNSISSEQSYQCYLFGLTVFYHKIFLKGDKSYVS